MQEIYSNMKFQHTASYIVSLAAHTGHKEVWPKNQKRCWYNIGSPPPAGSKTLVLKFLSVNSMVIAPANTGRDKIKRIAVMKTAHTKRGNLCIVIPGVLIFIIVVMTPNWSTLTLSNLLLDWTISSAYVNTVSDV